MNIKQLLQTEHNSERLAFFLLHQVRLALFLLICMMMTGMVYAQTPAQATIVEQIKNQADKSVEFATIALLIPPWRKGR